MMKKWISLILAVAIFAAADFSCSGASVAAPEVSAQSAVLFCVENGSVLFEKDAYERLPMASTTKIMTSLLLCESGRLAETVTVSERAASTEGTAMGLRSGDRVTLRTLLYGMLLSSGNDAANMTAEALAGSVDSFAAQMNVRAAQIGMLDTHFANPSGLPDENHYSTAYDMALLARESLRNPVFADICAQQEAQVTFGNPPAAHTLTNHNRLLSTCTGVTGIKTGFTKAAGRCLVSSCERGGLTLIAVTLNAPDDWNDHAALFDYGFSLCKAIKTQYQTKTIQVPVAGGMTSSVAVAGSSELIQILSDSGETDEISVALYHDPFLYAPVRRGQMIGTAKIQINGFILDEIPLIAQSDCPIAEHRDNPWTAFFERIEERLEQFIFFWKDSHG